MSVWSVGCRMRLLLAEERVYSTISCNAGPLQGRLHRHTYVICVGLVGSYARPNQKVDGTSIDAITVKIHDVFLNLTLSQKTGGETDCLVVMRNVPCTRHGNTEVCRLTRTQYRWAARSNTITSCSSQTTDNRYPTHSCNRSCAVDFGRNVPQFHPRLKATNGRGRGRRSGTFRSCTQYTRPFRAPAGGVFFVAAHLLALVWRQERLADGAEPITARLGEGLRARDDGGRLSPHSQDNWAI